MNLRKLLTLAIITSTAIPVSADGPRGGLLRYAQWLHDGEANNDIQLVQGISQITGQPTDLGSVSGGFQTSSDSESGFGTLPSLEELLEPGFSGPTANSLNSEESILQNEAASQRVDSGLTQTAPVDIVRANTFNLVNTPDPAETIVEVAPTPTVKARRRSPLGLDPRIRGYYGGQIYTMFDGGYTMPVRSDLDGLLNKVDQSLIGNTEIISGPYGLRYGSGFSFINIDSIPTPRYQCGCENHLRLGTQIRTNGGQSYNTATVFGGGERAGYYANLNYRKGSDYDAGNNLDIPSSYEAFNLFSGFGYDLNDTTKMETRFSILDLGFTEYAAQIFDVDDMKYYGLNHSIIHKDDCTGLGYRIDAWVSNNQFDGNTLAAGKRRPDFPVLQRVDVALDNAISEQDGQLLGFVDGELTLAGIRAGATRSYADNTTVGAGVDFRYIRQNINELYNISSFYNTPPADAIFTTGLPTAETFDPGLYAELSGDYTDYWSTSMGARVSFASTNANASELREGSNFEDVSGNLNRDFDVSDTLAAFYINNDVQVSHHWRSRVGMGYAERVPDLTDRYSDGLFLAIIQSGFSRVIGNPELAKERNWQVDLRVDGEYENCRCRISGFHSWIVDYITYTANTVGDPLGARVLNTINTDYATLAGAEAYGEADLDRNWQAFAGLSYLDGRDREIDQPLSGIYPFESRIGIRWIDSSPLNAWGVEWGFRFVENQDRLGTLRAVPGAGVGELVTLETPTPGFGVSYLRSYFSPSDGISITAGVENLFDKNYYEHLNLRLPADPANGFIETIVLSPGITPYMGIEVEY